MSQEWLYTILSVFGVGVVSLIGLALFSVKHEKLNKILLFLVSFAAGALLGDAFLHLLPEAFAQDGSILNMSAITLLGIVVFFILEKLLKWHHCHDIECGETTSTLGPMILIGDGVHNFIDGVIIAGSYLISIPLGVVTTLAVLLHEVPQEVGDYGVLIHSGYSRKKALLLNLASALTAVLGAVIVLILGRQIESIIDYILPFTVGSFIYIATADLIPELHKEVKLKRSMVQLVSFLFGIGLMALLLLVEIG